MAAWSVLLWHKTIDMLEHGTDVCVIPKSPIFINCNKTDHVTGLKTKQSYRTLKNPGTVILQEISKKVTSAVRSLHLFRCSTHTPRCRGAFLEDAPRKSSASSDLVIWVRTKK